MLQRVRVRMPSSFQVSRFVRSVVLAVRSAFLLLGAVMAFIGMAVGASISAAAALAAALVFFYPWVPLLWSLQALKRSHPWMDGTILFEAKILLLIDLPFLYWFGTFAFFVFIALLFLGCLRDFGRFLSR